MGRTKGKAVTMKAAAERAAREIRPLVKELIRVEHDAEGIDFQLSRVGVGRVGVDEVMAPLQRAVDRRFQRTTGVKPQGEYADPAQIRRLLDVVGEFFAAVGVTIDTSKPAADFEAWVDDPEWWDELPASDGISRRIVPRYELAGVTADMLNRDGSLRR